LATTTVNSAQSNTTITNGNTFDVVSGGGSLTSDTIQNGGSAIIESGATDTGTNIQAGGIETVLGAATSDVIAGTQIVSAATATATNETVVNGGVLDLFLKGVVATGTTVSSGGTLNISGNAVASNTVLSGGSTLALQSAKATISGSLTFSGTATLVETALTTSAGVGDQAVNSGFGANGLDTIDLTLIAPGATLSSSTSGSNTIETVTSGATSISFTFAGTSYAANYFTLSNDATTGVQITAGTPCYCPGTLIATAAGEVPVETLAIGDLVRTASGALRPVKWMGRRAYGGRFAAGQTQILPVRIAAGAIADGVPARDLFVSPLHAMLIDGVLVPAMHLVNGISVVQLESVETVEYIHVELDSHDVILAEGAASETFVDDSSRGMFHNAAEFAALYPDTVAQPARYCAPRVEEGEALAAIRRKLAARATPALAAWGALEGSIDVVTRSRIAGWAFDAAKPDEAVRLQVTADDVVLCEIVAGAYRPDLAEAGIGDGRHSFDITVPGGLPDATAIRIVRVADGAALPARRVA
jgi:autotransporter passenger strand-loop-strand repeat protein